MLDQAPCGPAVPCLSRQARAAVMVRLRGEADAGHRSAVSGHRSPVKRVIGRQCHSGVSVIRVNTGMVNFRKFLLPNKAVIFLKIFREIYICPKVRDSVHSATDTRNTLPGELDTTRCAQPTPEVPRRTSLVRNLRRPWAPREHSLESTEKG